MSRGGVVELIRSNGGGTCGSYREREEYLEGARRGIGVIDSMSGSTN